MWATLACLAGRHDWSGWEPFGYLDRCELRATCCRDGCGRHRYRDAQPHDFRVVPGEDPCSTRRACVRCGFATSSEHHAMSAWTVPDPVRPCERVRRCADCDRAESRTTHVWPPVPRSAVRTEDGWIDYWVCNRCPLTIGRRHYRTGVRVRPAGPRSGGPATGGQA